MNDQCKSISGIDRRRIRLEARHHDTRLRAGRLLSAAADDAAARFTDRLHIDRQLRRLLAPDTGLRVPHIEFQRIIAGHHIISGRKGKRKFPAVGHRSILGLISRDKRLCLQIPAHIRLKRPLRHHRRRLRLYDQIIQFLRTEVDHREHNGNLLSVTYRGRLPVVSNLQEFTGGHGDRRYRRRLHVAFGL